MVADQRVLNDESEAWAWAKLRARARLVGHRRGCTEDPNSFVEAVLHDEMGKPLVQSDFHREWQASISANDRLVLFAPVEHGKTIQVCVARVLWELGRRLEAGGSPRVLLVSKTQRQAAKPLHAIKAHIENSKDLHRVFPRLRRSNFEEWTSTSIRLRPGSPTTAKDPTVQAIGVDGAIQGGRVDLAIIDDVLDVENTWTHDQRRKVIEWFESTVPGRMVDGGQIIVVGTAWHPHDLMHHLGENVRYNRRRYPAEDQEGKPLWPGVWSPERLRLRREELTPYRYAQQMLCKAVSDDTSRFDPAWFDRCKELGRGLTWPGIGGQDIVVTGVDLGVKQKTTNDRTAMFTIGVDPTTGGKRRILWADAGRWRKREIVERLQGVHRRFGGYMMVEDIAAQNYLIQDLEDQTSIPVMAYQTTGERKRDPRYGIESIGVDLENRRWEIPCDQHGRVPEVLQAWQDECMEYKPTEHAGDLLMAGYFALEGVRRLEFSGGGIFIG
jgi:hypothetical protein